MPKKTYLTRPGETSPDYLERARRYCQRIYDFADTQGRHYSHGHWTHLMSDALLRTQAAFPDLGTFGVEGDCEGNGSGHYDVLYLNAGDTYAATLLCTVSPVVEVGDWGSAVEAAEEEDNAENGTITCAYCSHHTPLAAGADWRETVCESCGHYADGSEVTEETEED